VKKILFFVTFLLIASFSNAQLLVENFDYPVGSLLTANGWTNHSGTGTFLTTISGNLSYAGYPLSNVGNMIYVTGGSGSREDINKQFPMIYQGSAYASFLINVDSASLTGDYFLHFAPVPMGSAYRARVYVRGDGASGFQLGLSKGSINLTVPAVFTTASYSFNTTYLIVAKYEIIGDTAGTDDIVKLYVNPNLSLVEPAIPTLVHSDTSVGNADKPLATLAIRQGANGLGLRMDGVMVSNSWPGVVPVELANFSANTNGNSVDLQWATATETNNNGFEVLRNGTPITFINGNGTSTVVNNYAYSDKNVSNGKHLYQLRQVDFDGTSKIVAQTEVEVNFTPGKFELMNNYPNPFNPSTVISYQLPIESNVLLKVFNVLGDEVATLVNGQQTAGAHSVNFNASDLSSGIYFYTIEAGSFTATKKMILTK